MQETRIISELAAQESTSGPADAGPDARSRVTAVVCTHNGAAFLERQLASILAQTRPVAEVIVSDDASRDGTPELAASVLARAGVAHRVYERDAALGVAGNFAFAIAHARTELVALADQDDEWHPDKLERLVPLLDDPAVLLVHSDAVLVDEDGHEIEPSLFASLEIGDAEWADYTGGRAFEALVRRNLVTGATAVVRRSLAERAGAAPEPWIHDEWLAVAAALTDGIRVVREPLVDYRQHGANQIGQRTPTLADKVRKATGPGYAVQERKYRRAVELLRASRRLGATDAQEALIRRKCAHERRRLVLPANRMLRVPRVLRWYARGDYATYSRGRIDVVRDLLQSLRDTATA